MSPRDRQRRMLEAFIRWTAGGSGGARAIEFDGVLGAVVSTVPDHSIPNSVAFESAGHLEAAYDELASAYENAGVRAWTVWVPDADHAAHEFLAGRGHALDGEPQAMELDLTSFEPVEPGNLDWDSRAEPGEFGRVNDIAYGHAPGEAGIETSIAGVSAVDQVHLYRARVGGEVACVLGIIDTKADAGLIYVATLPEVRGRGLSSRLLSRALVEARERGMQTSSLQASEMGEPVYRRAGYRNVFRFGLRELRTSPPG